MEELNTATAATEETTPPKRKPGRPPTLHRPVRIGPFWVPGEDVAWLNTLSPTLSKAVRLAIKMAKNNANKAG